MQLCISLWVVRYGSIQSTTSRPSCVLLNRLSKVPSSIHLQDSLRTSPAFASLVGRRSNQTLFIHILCPCLLALLERWSGYYALVPGSNVRELVKRVAAMADSQHLIDHVVPCHEGKIGISHFITH